MYVLTDENDRKRSRSLSISKETLQRIREICELASAQELLGRFQESVTSQHHGVLER